LALALALALGLAGERGRPLHRTPLLVNTPVPCPSRPSSSKCLPTLDPGPDPTPQVPAASFRQAIIPSMLVHLRQSIMRLRPRPAPPTDPLPCHRPPGEGSQLAPTGLSSASSLHRFHLPALSHRLDLSLQRWRRSTQPAQCPPRGHVAPTSLSVGLTVSAPTCRAWRP